MKKLLMVSCALALAGACTTALAHEGSAGFIRGEIGRSDISVDFSGDFDGIEGEEDGTSAIFSGGYWFNSNFAIEGHLGTLYTEEIEDDVDFDLVSLGLGLAVKKNFGADNNGFFIAGRAGIARMVAQVRTDTFDVDDSEDSTKPYFGVGIGYDFSQRFGLSLNFDRRQGDFDVDGINFDVDVDTLTLGGEFRF